MPQILLAIAVTALGGFIYLSARNQPAGIAEIAGALIFLWVLIGIFHVIAKLFGRRYSLVILSVAASGLILAATLFNIWRGS